MPEWNGVDDPRTMLIEDARGREPEFTLEPREDGFTLIKAPTAVRDFYDPAEIKSVYYPEVERLLLHTFGASRVVVFDHNVRIVLANCRGSLLSPRARVHQRPYCQFGAAAGCAYIWELKPKRQLLKYRFGIVNVWRPIRGPVLDSPLALCDARSFTDDDLIATDRVYQHVRGETSSVEFKPEHRWYYFSEQQRDEVVAIRVHGDSDQCRASHGLIVPSPRSEDHSGAGRRTAQKESSEVLLPLGVH